MPALVVPEIQNRRWSGQTLRAVDVAREYGFTDVVGKVLSRSGRTSSPAPKRRPGSSGRRFVGN
jgi:hypothetical protein